MSIAGTTAWRIRAGGSNSNSGGYNPANTVAAAMATTLTAAITSSGQTSINVASASGWPTSGNYYVCLSSGLAESAGGSSEIVLVTGGQSTTTWTIQRGKLGTSALASLASGATVNNDFSRCDTASETGTLGTASGTTTFSDSGASFNGTESGNIIAFPGGAAVAVTDSTGDSGSSIGGAEGWGVAGAVAVGITWSNAVGGNTASGIASFVPANTSIAPTLVAHAAMPAGGGTTSAINTTGAKILVAAVSTYVSSGTISDSKSNTWVPLTANGSGGNAVAQLFYVVNPTVGTGHTFTSSGSYISASVAAFAGVATTSPFDEQTGSTGSGSTLATGNITPSNANSLIVSVMSAQGVAGGTFTGTFSPPLTQGFYEVVSVTNSTTLVLDRSPGTGSGASWLLGGGWADTWTNLGQSITVPVAGNFIYARGAGTNNPTSPDYTYAGGSYSVTFGYHHMIGENGRPMIRMALSASGTANYSVAMMWKDIILQGSNPSGGYNSVLVCGSGPVFQNVTFDQNGHGVLLPPQAPTAHIGCEFTSSAVASGDGPLFGLSTAEHASSVLCWRCNFHDTYGHGVVVGNLHQDSFLECIFAKCSQNGVANPPPAGDFTEGPAAVYANCTFDGNGANGLDISSTDQTQISSTVIVNCLFTNHTAGGAFGLTAGGGTAAVNNLLRSIIDFNFFYNNTTDIGLLSLNYGSASHNSTGTNPGYAAQSTEGYQIGAALLNAGYPNTAVPQSLAGKTATQSYLSPGAVQSKQASAASGGNLLLGVWP